MPLFPEDGAVQAILRTLTYRVPFATLRILRGNITRGGRIRVCSRSMPTSRAPFPLRKHRAVKSGATFWKIPSTKRQSRDMHLLDENGAVACNPWDHEASHRAEVEGIAAEKAEVVTCKKCRLVIRRSRTKDRPQISEK